jgi:hypothetical protein
MQSGFALKRARGKCPDVRGAICNFARCEKAKRQKYPPASISFYYRRTAVFRLKIIARPEFKPVIRRLLAELRVRVSYDKSRAEAQLQVFDPGVE